MSDLISRQAAIEIVDRYNKSHMILQGKPMLGAASIVIELEALPSAQPEIIRCKECKNYGAILFENTQFEHGDLIDRDALNATDSWEWIRHDAPVVIPAERSGCEGRAD